MEEHIRKHLEESKRLIQELADKILLDDKDLKDDTRRFAIVHQKMENIIISDHLRDLANKRINNANDLFGKDNVTNEYSDELIELLQNIVREQS